MKGFLSICNKTFFDSINLFNNYYLFFSFYILHVQPIFINIFFKVYYNITKHNTTDLWASIFFFTKSVPRPIQSISCNVRLLPVVCVGPAVTLKRNGMQTSGQRKSFFIAQIGTDITIYTYKPFCQENIRIFPTSITKPPAAKHP